MRRQVRMTGPMTSHNTRRKTGAMTDPDSGEQNGANSNATKKVKASAGCGDLQGRSALPVRGRFAPSPTGRMHLGNAFAALMCWLGARSRGGQLVLRVEDIDPQRSRDEFYPVLEEDLRWLGLDWDEGPDVGGPYAPYTQGERLESYAAAVRTLVGQGAVYPCYCTRKELRQAAERAVRRNAGRGYPGFCRNLTAQERSKREVGGRNPALRCVLPERESVFEDACLGTVRLHTRDLGGDFPVRRSDGVFAYQLAVVADDMAMNITQVVRGEDILDSTPRQLRLYELLGATPPEYAHVPLLVDTDGKKLSKRHQSLELAALRERGVSPHAVTGWLAHACGLRDTARPLRPGELLPGFSFRSLCRGPIVVPRDITDILLSMG